jgi:hypothetical protein
VKALQGLKARAAGNKLQMLWTALTAGEPQAAALPFLKRLRLDAPAGLQARIARRLLGVELRRVAGTGSR